MRFRRDIGAVKRGRAKNVQNEAMMVSEFIKKDAFKAFDVLKAGGIAIIPMDVGYTCAGGSGVALKKILKRRFKQAPRMVRLLCS